MVNDGDRIVYIAETDFRNKHKRFGIKAKDRSRHMYVIGKTGMGKSTLLENMAIQDIQNGEGLAFIDPHGGSADLLLDYIPKERIKDVIYFAPFDSEFPVSFNVMEDVGKDQRHLVADGLLAAFKKIWPDVWSARMEYILNNIMLALLEYPDSTLLGVNRMLSDKDYRNLVVSKITDPTVRAFWVEEFAKYTEKFMTEAGAAIQNKIGQFTSNPIIRNIIGQSKSTFDIRDAMDNRKILIMNLSKGRIGENNAGLIGGMLITKIYLAAMSRANASAEELKRLPSFYFYVDEFQTFVNESFADILAEARKYKLNLTIAHQYIEQMPEEVRDAVFGNVGTTISFRVGPFDAEVLEKVFGPKFTLEDLVNLGFAQTYMTLMIDGVGSPPFSAVTLPPIPRPPMSYKEEVLAHSRAHYARAREMVEADTMRWYLPLSHGGGGVEVPTAMGNPPPPQTLEGVKELFNSIVVPPKKKKRKRKKKEGEEFGQGQRTNGALSPGGMSRPNLHVNLNHSSQGSRTPATPEPPPLGSGNLKNLIEGALKERAHRAENNPPPTPRPVPREVVGDTQQMRREPVGPDIHRAEKTVVAPTPLPMREEKTVRKGERENGIRTDFKDTNGLKSAEIPPAPSRARELPEEELRKILGK